MLGAQPARETRVLANGHFAWYDAVQGEFSAALKRSTANLTILASGCERARFWRFEKIRVRSQIGINGCRISDIHSGGGVIVILTALKSQTYPREWACE